MDYEKKYKEAQKWIESIYSELSHEQQMEAEAVFPELKESEDERIRKTLIRFFKDNYPNETEMYDGTVTVGKALAWLEKQEGCEYIKKDWLEHIKQSWYKEGFIDGKYGGGTSKEWTINDAAILKEIIDFLENGTAKLQHDLTKYANWLKIQFAPIEKQGEQKTSVLDFKAEDWCVSKVDGKIHNIYNSVAKVEPKFKVGDWIIRSAEGFKHNTYLVTEVKDYYVCEELKGRRVTFTFNDVHKNFKLWDISDAKDGDVLVVPPVKGSEHSEQIFIFKEIKDREYVKNAVEYYCRCMDNEFAANECGFMGQSDDYFEPATKEQRDTLIKAMTDAGYTFDFGKKELKKISQRMVSAETKEALYDKPAWSEEDEDMVRYIGNAITCKESTKYLEEKGIDMIKAHRWLESFKPQLKKEWSEEDENKIDTIISVYHPSHNITNWLKSLKQRIGGEV